MKHVKIAGDIIALILGVTSILSFSFKNSLKILFQLHWPPNFKNTIVSFDFATSVIPGWHTTIFPPYFVAGAIFSGFAMVLTLMLITRKVLNLEDYITIEHIESMNKVILLTGSIVGVAYLTELFIAWYSGYVYEQFACRTLKQHKCPIIHSIVTVYFP